MAGLKGGRKFYRNKKQFPEVVPAQVLAFCVPFWALLDECCSRQVCHQGRCAALRS